MAFFGYAGLFDTGSSENFIVASLHDSRSFNFAGPLLETLPSAAFMNSTLPRTSAIYADLLISPKQIQTAIDLLNNGNSIPAMARYRKSATTGLDENAAEEPIEEDGRASLLADRSRGKKSSENRNTGEQMT